MRTVRQNRVYKLVLQAIKLIGDTEKSHTNQKNIHSLHENDFQWGKRDEWGTETEGIKKKTEGDLICPMLVSATN